MGNFSFYKSEYIETVTITDTAVNFAEHSHSDDFVATLLTSGLARLIVNQKHTDLSTGQIFMVAPYVPHSLYSESPVTLISVCVKKQAVYGFEKSDFIRYIRSTLSALNFSENVLNMLSDSLIGIYEAYHDTECAEDEFGRGIIEHTPESEHSLSQLAEKAHFSKYHYLRKFRKCSGLTPRKFQIQSRIRKAQKLLAGGSSVAETAAETGFYDQSHFDKYFRKIVGISPSEYINSLSNFLQAQR